MMHRLTYIIGKHQRLQDSVRNEGAVSSTGFDIHPKSGSKNDPAASTKAQRMRAVHSICVLDGNSVGYLFRPRKKDGDLKHDLTRRRSFRFNSTWYIALAQALSSSCTYGPDRVAAWVCAGDDIVLAQYGGEDESNPMDDVLADLDKNINADFTELTPLTLTFSGGHCLRIHGGIDRRIRDTYKDAQKMEKLAKNRWKTIAEDGFPEYLELIDGGTKEFQRIDNISGDLTHYQESENTPLSLIIRHSTTELEFTEPKKRPIMVNGKLLDYTRYVEGIEVEIEEEE
jgi:hypothetical protein